jgi:uncharacterized protein
MAATSKDGRPIEFARDDANERYTGTVEGKTAAVAAFSPAARLIVFTHTQTDQAFEGQGVASQLVRWALDDVRARGLHVVAVCPFVRAFIERHRDEYGDLIFTSRTTVVHD